LYKILGRPLYEESEACYKQMGYSSQRKLTSSRFYTYYQTGLDDFHKWILQDFKKSIVKGHVLTPR
jgi:hypothetical protein